MPQLLPTRFATECIREFELAATERYLDAIQLADSNRRTGAIYLFGYVVEMLLKVGFLRLAGYADDDPVSPQDLRQHVGTNPTSTARSLGLPGSKNLHDLSAWSDLIIAYRSSRNRPYNDNRFAAKLHLNVSVIAHRWTEAIRYHKNYAYVQELTAVRVSSAWILRIREKI